MNKCTGSISTEDYNQLFFRLSVKSCKSFFQNIPLEVLFKSPEMTEKKKKIAEAGSLGLFVAQFRGTPFWTNGDHKL